LTKLFSEAARTLKYHGCRFALGKMKEALSKAIDLFRVSCPGSIVTRGGII
jgi:hypothetical protein